VFNLTNTPALRGHCQ